MDLNDGGNCMKKLLFLTTLSLLSGVIAVSAQPPMPTGQVVAPPGSVNTAPPSPTAPPPPGAQPGAPLPPGSSVVPPTASPIQQSQLPSPPPPPPNVVNQGFNLFKQNPTQNQNKPQPPPNIPNGLPSLQSLLGNQTPISSSNTGVILYGTVCNGVYCKAVTNYGILTKGECITRHMCVKAITSNSITLETMLKIGKKEKRSIQTIGLFMSSGNAQ